MSNITDQIKRPLGSAMSRGWRKKCPKCNNAPLFRAYLKVNETCPSCGLELHHHRADDAPPYFTIFIVGHFIVAGMLITERLYHPEMWVHWSIFIPGTVVLSLWFLGHIKGALVGLQWSLRMHGFEDVPD